MQPWWCGATNPSVKCQSLSLTSIFFQESVWDPSLHCCLHRHLLLCPVLPQHSEWEKQLHLLLRSNSTKVSKFYWLPLTTYSPAPVSPSAALRALMQLSWSTVPQEHYLFNKCASYLCHLPTFALKLSVRAANSHAFSKHPKPALPLQPPLTGQAREGRLTIFSRITSGQPGPNSPLFLLSLQSQGTTWLVPWAEGPLWSPVPAHGGARPPLHPSRTRSAVAPLRLRSTIAPRRHKMAAAGPARNGVSSAAVRGGRSSAGLGENGGIAEAGPQGLRRGLGLPPLTALTAQELAVEARATQHFLLNKWQTSLW